MRNTAPAIRRLTEISKNLTKSSSIPTSIASASTRLVHNSSRAMATSTTEFKQEKHKLLLIPGPIEVSDDVLFANAHPSASHVGADFIPVFGDCIRMLREVLFTRDGQPFIIAGSGTLGWDQVASNLIEPGENALVLNTGYFGDSFVDCLETYGAKVTQVKAPLGASVDLEEVERTLRTKSFKAITITHVDTSTGVLSDAKSIAEATHRVSPNTLVILDGVCSVASEEIRFDEWGIDVVLSASQKGLGTPPGLSVLCASQKALKVLKDRRTPVTSYYANWNRWLPIMEAYEKGSASYFATPSVNLIYSFNASLKAITKSNVTLEDRFRLHKEASAKIKQVISDLGLQQVPIDAKVAANGMTAVYYPDGLGASHVLPKVVDDGIVIAGGLHKDVKNKYFRIGHMGISVVNEERGDLDRLIESLKGVFA